MRLRLIICTAILVFTTLPLQAQITVSREAEVVRTKYVVTDDAVISYYSSTVGIPYKIYDFSTRSVYVYFGRSEEKSFAQHSFSDISIEDIEHIQKIGCDNVQLNNAFKRYCE